MVIIKKVKIKDQRVPRSRPFAAAGTWHDGPHCGLQDWRYRGNSNKGSSLFINKPDGPIRVETFNKLSERFRRTERILGIRVGIGMYKERS